ncbi:MAG: MFS transporter [Sphingobium sp. 66-54]|nr:MAG: MFS transporter [Sphingobium sp. 66-54]
MSQEQVQDAQGGRRIDVARLLNDRKLNAFNIKLICLSWLITAFDGFDQMMISFTAPYMRDEFSLTNGEIGYIVSAGIAGMLAGGFLFSWIADRIGRRPTIIATAFLFGVLTLATAFAHNVPQLLALRFADGLAIGGMLPLAWALNIEFVPAHVRATVVTTIMMGYAVGTSSAGPLTNLLAPDHGWQAVYIAGGFGTLVCAVALLFFLPESVRFLVSRQIKLPLARDTLNRVDAAFDIRETDGLYLGDEPAIRHKFHVSDLFAGKLAWLTPLIWFGYAVSSLGIYFASSWGPLILEFLEVDRQTAATVTAFSGLLGAAAGLALMRFTDRYGPIAVAVFPAISVPILLILGLEMVDRSYLLPMVVLTTTVIAGGHFGIQSICGIFYPSAIRASGAGWASSIAKVGGVLGPVVGAIVLSSGLPIIRSYAVLAICPAVLAVVALAIARVTRDPSFHPEARGTRPAPAE